MASIVTTVIGGIITFAQLVITADLIGIYTKADSFPSSEVRNVLIYALITAIWGVLLALALPIISSQYTNAGLIDPASPNALFFTFVVEVIAYAHMRYDKHDASIRLNFTVSASLLTKGAVNGGACIGKAAQTCHLYTAALVLEWIMAGFALVGMVIASWINQRSGLGAGIGYV